MKIKKITPIKTEESYDINIGSKFNHNYFVKIGSEDVLVHNSGKDPSKVDRSAAYMARYIAKNLVKANLMDKCTVQLSYAIGVVEPISVMVNSHGTSKYSTEKLEKIVRKVFKLTPRGIIDSLELLNPIYQKTASYGHFGRDDVSWEKCDKVQDILKEL